MSRISCVRSSTLRSSFDWIRTGRQLVVELSRSMSVAAARAASLPLPRVLASGRSRSCSMRRPNGSHPRSSGPRVRRASVRHRDGGSVRSGRRGRRAPRTSNGCVKARCATASNTSRSGTAPAPASAGPRGSTIVDGVRRPAVEHGRSWPGRRLLLGQRRRRGAKSVRARRGNDATQRPGERPRDTMAAPSPPLPSSPLTPLAGRRPRRQERQRSRPQKRSANSPRRDMRRLIESRGDEREPFRPLTAKTRSIAEGTRDWPRSRRGCPSDK